MGPEARNVYSEIKRLNPEEINMRSEIKRINPEIRWIDLEGI